MTNENGNHFKYSDLICIEKLFLTRALPPKMDGFVSLLHTGTRQSTTIKSPLSIAASQLVKALSKKKSRTNLRSSLHAALPFYSPFMSSAFVQREADFAAAFHLSVVEFVQIGSGNV